MPGWIHFGVPLVQEGKATFAVGGAFYRSKSAIARDLAVLAAAVYRQRYGYLRGLDAMTCGVRPLRYRLEAKADFVWANEGNSDLADLLRINLAALPADTYRLTHGEANQIFFTCYQGRHIGLPLRHASSLQLPFLKPRCSALPPVTQWGQR